MRSTAVFTAACAQRGVERYRRGALADAMADLEAALDSARGQPWETLVDDGRAHMLRVHVERGELERADVRLQEWCANGPLPETNFGNRILIERGRLRLAQARFPEAVVDLEAASRRLGARGQSVLFDWRSPAALARHFLGDHREALELADADLEIARAWGAPRNIGIALVTLALIEGRQEGIRLLQEAVETLDGTPALLERARALVDLGAMLRRNGEPSKARPYLSTGRELAEHAGARRLVVRAAEEFAATGARRRRRTLLTGPDALTPTERRVADLAMAGLSNPAIAHQLFITRKTVEMHLGNAYRKLEITSRQHLNLALRRRQPS
jgi:DNA-binding CsgD family transcriptional regulator